MESLETFLNLIFALFQSDEEATEEEIESSEESEDCLESPEVEKKPKPKTPFRTPKPTTPKLKTPVATPKTKTTVSTSKPKTITTKTLLASLSDFGKKLPE